MKISVNVIFWKSSERLALWQSRFLLWRLYRRIKKRRQKATVAGKTVRRICTLLQSAICGGDAKKAAALTDLLKAAYKEGMARPSEELHLMDLCVAALRHDQDDLAASLLEAYAPLLQQADCKRQKEILEHFVVLSHIAKKLNRRLISDKITACVFQCIDLCGFSRENASSVCKLLKAVGILVVKWRNYSAFCRARGFAGRLAVQCGGAVENELTDLLLSWAHIILKRDYREMFVEFQLMCFELQDACGGRLLYGFCRGAVDFSLMIASNQDIECGARFLTLVMKLAEKDRKAAIEAVRLATKTSCVAVDMYGIDGGFQFLYPLLNEGRQLLEAMQRLESCGHLTNRRYLTLLQQGFATILFLIERLERKPAEKILGKIWLQWRADCAGNEQEEAAAAEFCQLLLLRISKRSAADKERLNGRARSLVVG